ncbi:MAG: carbohydrate ABC transporter permease [Anaerolineales bacterium]|nr:carbohydrate ABC transporter permease [Anaerolineales bacterium]
MEQRRSYSGTFSEDFLLYLFLGAFVLLILFPYLWMVLTSFKPVSEIFTPEMRLFPREWHPENYLEVLRTGSFSRYVVNSIIVTGVGVLLEVTVSFLGAFAFARLDFYGKDIAFYMVLGTLMIPPQVLMLPSYLIVSDLGWIDSYAGLIIPRAGGAFGIFLLRQFMLTVPADLDDAAQIDGANLIQRMIRVYLPLCIPSVVTLSVFSMIGFWNDYYWPLVITTRDEMRTLALGISHFKSLEGMGNWQLLMAAATLATIPMILVFIAARKSLIENITSGAIKG